MSIKIGNTNIADIKLGNQNIKKVYRGSDLIWEKQSPTPTGDNKLTYDGTEYILVDNIAPDLFVTYSSGSYKTQTYPLKNGETLVIDYSDETERAKLTSLELHTFSKTQIGNYFLSYCTSLSSVDLSGLSSVTSIGDNFLDNCTSLASLNLDLPILTKIGNSFLSCCEDLTSLTLDFPVLTQIGDGFLNICSTLNSLTLNFPILTQIGHSFLCYCEALTSLTLDFPALTQINYAFLYSCSALTTLTLWDQDPQTITIKNKTNWLYNTPNLNTIYVPGKYTRYYNETDPWDKKSGKYFAKQ